MQFKIPDILVETLYNLKEIYNSINICTNYTNILLYFEVMQYIYIYNIYSLINKTTTLFYFILL